MKQYSFYAFDLDLTLLDTLETSTEAYQAAFKSVGLVFDPKTVTHHLSISLEESYAEIGKPGPSYRVFFDTFIEMAKRTFLDKSHYYEDAISTLSQLKSQGRVLGIVTNRDINVVIPSLKNAGILDYFSSIVTSSEVVKLKPDPEPIELSIKQLGATKDEYVYVGDAKNDWMAANNAGVDFIAIERYDNCSFTKSNKVHSLVELLG